MNFTYTNISEKHLQKVKNTYKIKEKAKNIYSKLYNEQNYPENRVQTINLIIKEKSTHKPILLILKFCKFLF